MNCIINDEQAGNGKTDQQPSLSLASLVNPGISQRKDFPLIACKAALLIIDVQDHLSSSIPSSTSSTNSNSGATTSASTSSSTLADCHDDHRNVNIDINSNNRKEKEYFFSTALPTAMPNMIELVNTFRSIRDHSTLKKNSLYENSGDNKDDNSPNDSCCSCEVIFTYLESLTTNSRDISLDYKFSGPLLSSELPTSINKATFHHMPKALQPNPRLGKGDILLPKSSCSVFASTNINYVLRNLNIEQIVVCGQLTDQCVLSAVRDAADLGYFVTVVNDACAASSLNDHERGILGMQGFARVVNTKNVIEELQGNVSCISGEEKAVDFKTATTSIAKAPKLICPIPTTTISTTTTTTNIRNKLILPSTHTWKPFQFNNGHTIEALLHTLQYANIKFLRYASIDISNSIRTKVIPIKNLLQSQRQQQKYQNNNNNNSNHHHHHKSVFDDQISIAKVCMGGLPSYADVVLPDTNLSARHVLIVQPDISSLRILPYAPSSAMVFGTLHKRRSVPVIADGDGHGSEGDSNDTYGELSEFCTRGLLQRVLQTAKDKLGIGFGVGAEIEFILVRQRNINQQQNSSLMDVIEPVDSTVFASTTTLNEQDDFINDVYNNLQKQNIDVETLHSESAPGQIEIVLPYQTNVIKLADMVVLTRETIKACARNHGLCALFLPKVFEQSAGNGMHVHLSLSSIDNPGQNLFPSSEVIGQEDDGPQLLSNMGQSFLEGILSHLKGLTGITMPTVNSFRRVGPGCWTGHSVSWMVEEKECPLRVCLDLASSSATNVEYKLMDSSCNIYLALAAILFAGMDGIAQNMKLRPMMMSGAFDKSDKGSNTLPKSLEESVECLSNDALFLELMGEKLIESYTAVKRAEVEYSQKKSLVEEVQEAMRR
jgi:glutamine synthetase